MSTRISSCGPQLAPGPRVWDPCCKPYTTINVVIILYLITQTVICNIWMQNTFTWYLNMLPLSAFDGEHCYEPYLPHGNFSSSDITFPLGTVVTFSCSPGFVMEQGSGVMECVDPNDPHWNESEPVCRGMTAHIYSILVLYHSWTWDWDLGYGGCSGADKKALQRVIKNAQNIIGCPLPLLLDIANTRYLSRAKNIVKDFSHPGHHLFSLLPSGRRYKSIKTRTARLSNSFYPRAIQSLN